MFSFGQFGGSVFICVLVGVFEIDKVSLVLGQGLGLLLSLGEMHGGWRSRWRGCRGGWSSGWLLLRWLWLCCLFLFSCLLCGGVFGFGILGLL